MHQILKIRLICEGYDLQGIARHILFVETDISRQKTEQHERKQKGDYRKDQQEKSRTSASLATTWSMISPIEDRLFSILEILMLRTVGFSAKKSQRR